MKVEDFTKCLQKYNIDFYCGVPDSLLKSLTSYLFDFYKGKNIITANEGNAIALASGYHLATKKIACVYMQNSGLGNCVNPLLSLTDSLVYDIPVLLIVGWRGEPGKDDEPQHKKQGLVTLELLKTLGISYFVAESDTNIEEACKHLTNTNRATAIIIKKNFFDKYEQHSSVKTNSNLSRESAIATVSKLLDDKEIVVSTTGMISRELYEAREKQHLKHNHDFLTVGSMGHASSIALGIALNTKQQVFCFDGDGACLMHLGALSIIGNLEVKNFKHIVFNNNAHDSVGGQPTLTQKTNLINISLSSGYKYAVSVDSLEDLEREFKSFYNCEGPALLEIKVKVGHRNDLIRPPRDLIRQKEEFIEGINR